MNRSVRRPPAVLIAIAIVAAALFVLPLIGLLDSLPGPGFWSKLRSEIVLDALLLSLLSSTVAAAASVALGVPLAFVLNRWDFPGRDLMRSIVTLPMVLPPVVGGAALLFALGRRGIIGEPLEAATGFTLPFSIWGVILANTFVAMPFLVITVDGALASADRRREAAAAALGASPLTVFRRVTVPMIAPAIRAGAVLAWARAFGEFGATVTFAGNLQGRTQTLPLAVFVSLDSDRDAAVAISVLMVLVSLGVLSALRGSWWSTNRSDEEAA